jgi:hypothetical protein
MFFQATHLPFGPGSQRYRLASDVEEFWSPMLTRWQLKKTMQRHTYVSQVIFWNQHNEDLSLLGGASIGGQILFTLSITYSH